MSSSPKLAALLVGINKYPAPYQLRGCVPDIQRMLPWLRANRKLADAQTKVMLDGTATKRAILHGLSWLGSQEPDVALFYYSGHGSRVKDLDGDESTGFDQAIVNVDFPDQGLILDDDLQRAWMAYFSPRTKIVMVLDSCYSDRADRSFSQIVKGAYYKASGKRMPRMIPAEDIRGAVRATYQAVPRKWRAVPADKQREIIELAGCRDFETSADAYLGKKDGYRGAFSYFLEQALTPNVFGPQATYQQAIEEAQRRCSAQGYTQVPQLRGPQSHPEWLQAPIFT